MSKLLLTGFEPFGGRTVNPSERVATALDRSSISGFDVTARVLPVSFRRLPAILDQLLGEIRPDAILPMGLAAAAPRIRLEQIAVNAMHSSQADNDGLAPFNEQIEEAGPLARRATIELGPLVQRLVQDWQPVELSFHAGTHCCNLTLYHLLGRIARKPVPCAFIHLPCLPEQVASEPDLGQPAMALEPMIETVRQIASLAVLGRSV